MRNGQQGFTLSELLVVIAILGPPAAVAAAPFLAKGQVRGGRWLRILFPGRGFFQF